jgi:hypothetical protein
VTVITGSGGQLRFNGTKVAKCKDFSLDVSRDAIEDTALGSDDRTFVSGLRGASGSATIMYDPDDTATKSLLNSILSDSSSAEQVEFVLNTTLGKAMKASALITQVGTPVSAGEIVACSVNFQVTGPIVGTF